jgi:uncharacterized membrane protein
MTKIEKVYLTIIYSFVLTIIFSVQAKAVLPPDLIPQIANHVAYFFAIILGILSTLWISIINFIRIFYSHIKIPKWVIFVGILIVIVVSYLIAIIINNASN